jgi:L-fuconate dehydratase
MTSTVIRRAEARDRRFPLPQGAGTDAVHRISEYAFAVTHLSTDRGIAGTGIALTLGRGNPIVCECIRLLAGRIEGREIEDLMSGFGAFTRQLADDAEMRWLGPHKGAVHLALASISNACFDLWAKSRDVPLWQLLLSLTPREVAALLDLSYLEDTLAHEEAEGLLTSHLATRASREGILTRGYPGYDTSVGWFGYADEKIAVAAAGARERGFSAVKLKVGSRDPQRDLRRAALLREIIGGDARLMLDANQQWTLPEAERICESLRSVNPYWIEEPTHPDDIEAHATLAAHIAPLRIALGEHVPNRVMFKNFLRRKAVHFLQPDCTRLAGVGEFLTVSMLARKAGLPVAPHVGDMGQIHQHLVLFNHIALGHEVLFLEYIPHLREYFEHPAQVSGGVYRTPQEPGCSTDLLKEHA